MRDLVRYYYEYEQQHSPKIHVVIVHDQFGHHQDDRYMIDIGKAIHDHGHKVTVFAADTESYEEFDSRKKMLNFSYCGWWLANRFKAARAILTALRLIVFPPWPRPAVIILDIHPVCLYLLSYITNYKLIYVAHLAFLHGLNRYSKDLILTTDNLTIEAMKRADDIVVYTECLANILQRSFPTVSKDVRVVAPRADTCYCDVTREPLSKLLPELSEPYFLFACFGSYKPRNNFKIVLEAFEDILLIMSTSDRFHLHLVIAGHCSDAHPDEVEHYKELVEYIRTKPINMQITFIRNLDMHNKQSLIYYSSVIIIACEYDLFPDTIVAVLKEAKPIIASNSGYCREVLRHRITAILVQPTRQYFAAAMYRMITSVKIRSFLSAMGNALFLKYFSNTAFRRKVMDIIDPYTKHKVTNQARRVRI